MSAPNSLSSPSHEVNSKEGSNSGSSVSGAVVPMDGAPGQAGVKIDARDSPCPERTDDNGLVVEDWPALNIMIAGVTGVGKSALTYNLTKKGKGGIDSYKAATLEVQTFPNRLSLIPDPRKNAAPGSKIALNVIDLIGLCDPAKKRSVEVNLNKSLYEGWRHLQHLDCLIILVNKGREAEGHQDQTLQLVKAFKQRGLTNAQFLLMLTHIDLKSSEEEIHQFKLDLLDTSFAKEMGIVSTDAILGGVTQDYRKADAANKIRAEETCRNILLHVLREDAPAPKRFTDPVSNFSQLLDYYRRRVSRLCPPIPSVSMKMSINTWITLLLSLLVILLGFLVLFPRGVEGTGATGTGPGPDRTVFDIASELYASFKKSMPTVRSPFSFE